MATDDRRYSSGGKNDSNPAAPSLPGSDEWQPGPPKPPPPTTQNLEPLALPTGGPDLPPVARGAIRFTEEIRRSGLQQGTDAYDVYVLKMQPDPADAEYSQLVQKSQAEAKDRQDKAAAQAQMSANLAPGGGKGLTFGDINENKQDVDAKKQAQAWRGQVSPIKYVDANGNVIDPDRSRSGFGASMKSATQSADQAAADATGNGLSVYDQEEMTDGQFIAAGGAVWIGDTVVSPDGTHKVTQGQYRAASEMINDVYRWDTGQTAAFQKSVGLAVTGVADEKTVAFWKWAVNTARYYTAMGQHRSVDSIVQTGKQQISGGGGGGGGGSGSSVPADQAKRILNQVMKQYAGREATDAELKAFLPAIRAVAASDDFDATQFTTDWVRGGSNGARSGEVASYQAGTDYYSVVQQLIGGQ